MSLFTPPSTSHRTEKENRLPPNGSRVAWSPYNSYHSLASPIKALSSYTTLKEAPVKSILKKCTHVLLPFPIDKQREVTPEPLDPLVNLNYLVYPVLKIIQPDATLQELIEAHNVLAARLRGSVTDATDADASWPLFQPLRKNAEAFVKAVVRDVQQAFVDPLNPSGQSECRESARFSLPSPKSTPQKVKTGMSAEQVKFARDLCTTCHSAMRLLTVIMSTPAIFNVFTDKQHREMLSAVLLIPTVSQLPTPNTRKTCAIAISLIQAQRLSKDVLYPLRDRISNVIRRGLDGELGKEGKKGSASDGLKAIHDLCIHQPQTFVPSFTIILSSILSNLLAPTLALRLQACHALGGFAYGVANTHRSNLHIRISSIIAEYITAPSTPSTNSPTKSQESAIVRTLRTTLNALEPTHVSQGPVWALSVLASFVVLLGSRLSVDSRLSRILSVLLSLGCRHKKSSVRALCCLVWRTITWSYFQSPLLPDPDQESEVDDDKQDNTKSQVLHWKVVSSVVDLQAGVATIAALMNEMSGDEGMSKTIDLLHAMVKKSTTTCGDAVETIRHMVSFEQNESEWVISRLLPQGLFSSVPGLLTVDYKNIQHAVKPLFDQVPVIEDIRCLTREEITKDWVFDGLISVWRDALSCVRMGDECETPTEFVGVWEGLLKANVGMLQDDRDDAATSNFAIKAVDILIEILEDTNIDLSLRTTKSASSTINTVSSSEIHDDLVAEIEVEESTNVEPSGYIKLKVVRRLWSTMRTTFPDVTLVAAGEKLLSCLVKDEDELVESSSSARSIWAPFCAEVMGACDVSKVKRFWNCDFEAEDGEENWVWSRDDKIRASVWMLLVECWMENAFYWEGAAVLLGVPFTDANNWTVTENDLSQLEILLRYSGDKALDYGIDIASVLDYVAVFISQNRTPGGPLNRAAEFLMSNLDISDARDVPEAVMDLVNETMRSSYPPEPRSKQNASWLARSLAAVIEHCPLELCLRLLEVIQEGLCLWLSDEYEAWTVDELTYDIITVYEQVLCRVQDLPKNVKTLVMVTPILESVFCGRCDIAAFASEPFREFWQVSYATVPEPKRGWPKKILRCLDLASYDGGSLSETSNEVSKSPIYQFSSERGHASSKTLQAAFTASPASVKNAMRLTDINLNPPNSTPTTPVSIRTYVVSSPPRPQKPSVNFLESFPLQSSPGSPSLSRTPPRRMLKRATQSVSDKHRRVSNGNKENESPRALGLFTPIAERIAMRAETSELKPSSTGKRRIEDEALDGRSRAKKARLDIEISENLASPVPSDCGSVNTDESEDERYVASSLLRLGALPPPLVDDAVPSSLESTPRKRKRVFMESVEVPTLWEVNQTLRRTGSASSNCSMPKSSSRASKRLLKDLTMVEASKKKRCRYSDIDSDPFEPSPVQPIPALQLALINKPFSFSKRRIAVRDNSPVKPSQLSSDDDPRFGQVTPHHLISPAPRKIAQDPPSDDTVASSSPTKEVTKRRLERINSFSISQPRRSY